MQRKQTSRPECFVVVCLLLLAATVPLRLWGRAKTARGCWQAPSEVAQSGKPPSPSVVVCAHNADFWWVWSELGQYKQMFCPWRGAEIDCRFISAKHSNKTVQQLLQGADAYISEGCWEGKGPAPGFLQHLPVMQFNLESEPRFPCRGRTWKYADYHATYKRSSEVWVPYFNFQGTYVANVADLRRPARAVEQKRNAVIMVISNCRSVNGRNKTVHELQMLMHQANSKLAFHSYGRCQQNINQSVVQLFNNMSKAVTPNSGSSQRYLGKRAYFSMYKFCMCMENSNDKDYVTEKVYDGLAAGCIPIYYGASNIYDYIPHEDAIIDYNKLGSPQALLKELEHLASDPKAYQAKLAWKDMPMQQWSQGFQELVKYTQTQPACHICSFLAQQQTKPLVHHLDRIRNKSREAT